MCVYPQVCAYMCIFPFWPFTWFSLAQCSCCSSPGHVLLFMAGLALTFGEYLQALSNYEKRAGCLVE